MSEPPQAERRREDGAKLKRKDALRLVLVAALIVTMLLALRLPEVRHELFDIDHVRAELQAGDTLGERLLSRLAFVAIGAILVGVGMPRLYVATVAGVAYGALEGVAWGLAASLGGAMLLWMLGKSLLGSMVRRRLNGRYSLWNERFRQNAFWWVLYARLLPFTNSTLMNLLCGACRIPWRPYLTGTAVGFVPLTLAFATLGSGGAKGSGMQIALSALLLLGSVMLQRMLQPKVD